MNELEMAVEAAKEAGKIAVHYFGKVSAENKHDNTPVTVADKECEKKIVSIIEKHFPDDAILGEEHGARGSGERRWIIDPIDGTKNYIKRSPNFGVMIALEEKGDITCGVVHLPLHRKTYTAQRGSGAFVNGKQITLSQESDTTKSFVGMSREEGFRRYDFLEYYNRLISSRLNLMEVKGLGKLMMLAEGSVEAGIHAGGKEWDLAPWKILAEEAGGVFTDFNGDNSIKSQNAVISNGKIHKEILKALGG